MVGKWHSIIITDPLLPYWKSLSRITLLDSSEWFVESWDVTLNSSMSKRQRPPYCWCPEQISNEQQNRNKIEKAIETKRLIHEDQSLTSSVPKLQKQLHRTLSYSLIVEFELMKNQTAGETIDLTQNQFARWGIQDCYRLRKELRLMQLNSSNFNSANERRLNIPYLYHITTKVKEKLNPLWRLLKLCWGNLRTKIMSVWSVFWPVQHT